MTPSRFRLPLAAWLRLVGVALAILAGEGSVHEAAGQTAADLAQAEVRYEAALRDHMAAEAAMEEARVLFDQAVDARNLPVANERSQQLQNQQRRLRQTLAALTLAREGLTSALDRRLAHLLQVEFPGAASVAGREGILTLARDTELRLRQLDQTPPIDESRLAALAYPVTPDPRDTPQELISKARVLELRVSQADSLIARIDQRVEVLQDRQRNVERIQDFSANLGRFDSDRLRVGAPGSRTAAPRDAGAQPDTVGLPARTPLEEIEKLRELRQSIILLRDADRQRAIEIRRLAAGRPG